MHSSILADSGMASDVFWILLCIAILPAWLLLAALYTRGSGWRDLARRFPAPTYVRGRTFISAVRLRPTSLPIHFHKPVLVRIGPRGICLKSLLAGFAPPVFIPWRAIARCQKSEKFLLDTVTLDIAGHSTRVLLHGKPGEAVYRCFTGETLDQVFPTEQKSAA